jgi:hypothetical protein
LFKGVLSARQAPPYTKTPLNYYLFSTNPPSNIHLNALKTPSMLIRKVYYIVTAPNSLRSDYIATRQPLIIDPPAIRRGITPPSPLTYN